MIKFPIKQVPEMFCFGGINTTVEIDKIQNIEILYYQDFETNDQIPILHINLINDTVITIDYKTIEEAEQAYKIFMRNCKMKRVK